jgi:hypothetical protein
MKRKQHHPEKTTSQIKQWGGQEMEEVQQIEYKPFQEVKQHAKYQEQAIDGQTTIHGPSYVEEVQNSSSRGKNPGKPSYSR